MEMFSLTQRVLSGLAQNCIAARCHPDDGFAGAKF
jgi:hypothetical protein